MTTNFVICLGMQRSGSTLQYNLARSICRDFSCEKKLVVLGAITPDRFEELSGIVDDFDTKNIFLVKSHWLPRELIRRLIENHAVFLYIDRDLKDVYYSGKQKVNWSLDEFSSSIMRSKCSLRYMKEKGGDMLFQNYETVYCDLTSAIDEVASALKLTLTTADKSKLLIENDIERAIKIQRGIRLIDKINVQIRMALKRVNPSFRSKFKKIPLFRAIKRRLLHQNTFDSGTLIHANHISKSKGQPGAWKDNLSSDELEFIENLEKEIIYEEC